MAEESIEGEWISLMVSARGQDYSFACSDEAGTWQPFAENVDGRVLSTPDAGGFIGAYVGLYASSNGEPSDNVADFEWFEYVRRERP